MCSSIEKPEVLMRKGKNNAEKVIYNLQCGIEIEYECGRNMAEIKQAPTRCQRGIMQLDKIGKCGQKTASHHLRSQRLRPKKSAVEYHSTTFLSLECPRKTRELDFSLHRFPLLLFCQ